MGCADGVAVGVVVGELEGARVSPVNVGEYVGLWLGSIEGTGSEGPLEGLKRTGPADCSNDGAETAGAGVDENVPPGLVALLAPRGPLLLPLEPPASPAATASRTMAPTSRAVLKTITPLSHGAAPAIHGGNHPAPPFSSSSSSSFPWRCCAEAESNPPISSESTGSSAGPTILSVVPGPAPPYMDVLSEETSSANSESGNWTDSPSNETPSFPSNEPTP